ncbi:MAG: ATP synthase F1 subunit delta [Planctomyces sp.]|nr:ATP synthase F1 subunit delta [Planctomyces sp.]
MSEAQVQSRPAHVLEDPSTKAVARVYATAFLDAAASAGEPEPLEEFTTFHDGVVKANPELRQLFASPAVLPDQKLALIERAIAPKASPFFASFLRVLARHGRLDLLTAVLEEAWLEHEERQKLRRVQVRSAQALTDAQLTEIRDQLRSRLKIEPILQPSVDPSLLGGVVIQVGDTIYDSSLRTRVRELRTRLRERYLNEIQSGRNRFSYSEGN